MTDLKHPPEGLSLDPDAPDPDLPETQHLPLDAWHRARGGRMVPFADYHMPVQYEGIMAEHLWCRDHAGLFDVSHMGQLVFHRRGRGCRPGRARARNGAARRPDRTRARTGCAIRCSWARAGASSTT